MYHQDPIPPPAWAEPGAQRPPIPILGRDRGTPESIKSGQGPSGSIRSDQQMPQEYVARWTGGRIGAGATVFHFESIASSAAAQGLANAVRAMFASRVSSLSTDISLEFDTEVRDLAANGTLIGVYPVTRPADVVGTNTGGYTNGTGLLVRHSTGIIAGGRRLQGRTFIVPVSGADFSTNGDIQLTVQTAWNTAFAGLKTAAAATGANFAVWSRANAIVAPVTISSTLARPSTLRTRNDRV